jgi:UDP-glucose 4-epimerase
MRVLVVGGAGYIGSQMVKNLIAAGHLTWTLDNLSSGRREAVLGGHWIQGDLDDGVLLDRVFGTERLDAVMHFASLIQVSESISMPGKYYRNNVVATLNLLEAMVRHRVGRFIFSSSAAVFGEPQYVPLDESHPKNPINPYGRTKWMVEQMLADFDRAHGLKSVSLRYFNAAGADPEGHIGETHEPETHLIPLVLQAASRRRAHITVFGDDYATPDGTCIRDFVHVDDLAQAHLLALDYLGAGGASTAFNLGNGDGFSVRQVISTAEHVTGTRIPVRMEGRREGDPARLVADSGRMRRELGWRPRFNDLRTIITHAWQWERRLASAPRPIQAQ